MTVWLWASLVCNLALLVGLLMAIGRGREYLVSNRVLQSRVALLQDPDPICGCHHHYSFHEEKDGCHYTVVHGLQGKLGMRHVMTMCTCVQYTGPIPLPRYTSMEPREEA